MHWILWSFVTVLYLALGYYLSWLSLRIIGGYSQCIPHRYEHQCDFELSLNWRIIFILPFTTLARMASWLELSSNDIPKSYPFCGAASPLVLLATSDQVYKVAYYVITTIGWPIKLAWTFAILILSPVLYVAFRLISKLPPDTDEYV